MATTAAKTTTTPRARTTRATKTAPKTAPSAEVETPTVEASKATDRYVVELEYERDTKTYAKFNVPEELKGTMAGSIYAPLGTDTVKVAIMGAEANITEE